jgi:hypothetical protein
MNASSEAELQNYFAEWAKYAGMLTLQKSVRLQSQSAHRWGKQAKPHSTLDSLDG